MPVKIPLKHNIPGTYEVGPSWVADEVVICEVYVEAPEYSYWIWNVRGIPDRNINLQIHRLTYESYQEAVAAKRIVSTHEPRWWFTYSDSEYWEGERATAYASNSIEDVAAWELEKRRSRHASRIRHR